MQPMYPSLNAHNPNRLVTQGMSEAQFNTRPPRLLDPRLAAYNRVAGYHMMPQQFPPGVPQTAMVSPMLRPSAVNREQTIYISSDVRSQTQNTAYLAPCNANLPDTQWDNEVYQFAANINQMKSQDSFIETTQARLAKFAVGCKDMIENHRRFIQKQSKPQINENDEEEVCACLPPIETFTGVSKLSRKKHFYEYIDKGDLLCVQILTQSEGGFICVVVCMDGGKRRHVHDCDIKVFCPYSNCQPLSVSNSEFQDGYQIKDIIRVIVVNYNKYDMRIVVSMKDEHLPKEFKGYFKMGLINDDELPIHYRRQISMKSMSYDEMLRKTLSFNNPSASIHLAQFFGLPITQRVSFLRDLHCVTYPGDEFAKHLRKVQSTEMARQSVEEGVKYLKSGCHLEAQQCLNKALQIDCDNLDALVARGCLYANTNNLTKAADDFDKALSIDPEHVNARKYMGETLLEMGRICEDKGDLEGAAKNYRRVCQINTKNNEALEALKSIIEKKGMQRSRSPQDDLKNMYKDIKDKSYYESSQKLKLLLEEDKKRKKRSRRHRSSSSSSPSSSSSDTSSSSSELSSSSSSDSDGSSRRRSHKRRRSKKSKSKKSKRRKDKKKRSKSSKTIPGIKIETSKESVKEKKSDESTSTHRNYPKKQSPKISFTLKKNDSEIKTLKPTKPFASSTKAASPKRNPVTEKIVYNLDKLKPVSIEFVRNGLVTEKSNEFKSKKSSPRSRMYIPGRSRSRSRSSSRSRRRRRRSRTRSRSRSRAISRAVLRPSSKSPRRQDKATDAFNKSPFRERTRTSRRPRRSPSRERSRKTDSVTSKTSIQDALKKAAEEAKKVEAAISQSAGQTSTSDKAPKQDDHPLTPYRVRDITRP